MTEKANKAEKAGHLSLKDIFLIIEEYKLIPEVHADLPRIGPLENLYCYVYDCLSYCITNKTNGVQTDAYDFYFNQISIIFDCLIDNGLLKTEKRPVASVISKFQISSEILEQLVRFTNAEENGLLDDHPEREYIQSLWRAVLMYQDSPLLSLYLNRLRKVVINLVVIVESSYGYLYKYEARLKEEKYGLTQLQ